MLLRRSGKRHWEDIKRRHPNQDSHDLLEELLFWTAILHR
jgi:hypothetical protein